MEDIDSTDEDEDVTADTPKTLAEMFETECVTAMSLGMTYEQYWDEDVDMMVIYAKYYLKEQRSRFYEQDNQSWMIGAYMLDSLDVALGGYFGKRGAPRHKYPTHPKFIEQIDEKAKAKKKEREVQKSYNNFIAALQSMGKLNEEVVPQ